MPSDPKDLDYVGNHDQVELERLQSAYASAGIGDTIDLEDDVDLTEMLTEFGYPDPMLKDRND